MEKYLLDFLDDVVAGKYGNPPITKSHVAQFVEKANKEETEMLDELYWDWTSVLCEPEDINLSELKTVVMSAMKR